MAWAEVEYTDEFGDWWETLNEDEQDSIAVSVTLLQQRGPTLPFPYSSDIEGSKHGHMRELRIQHKGEPYRVLYAFDPRRTVILLIGGKKSGNDRWYDEYIPKADKLYDKHLQLLKKEGLL
ncbi:MAG: type II toxin-antitoxin system RelE/ParE family toxin [bacterium]|nr:type II toxin-antitoxin system RelE/ParE family toxin [bacterium]